MYELVKILGPIRSSIVGLFLACGLVFFFAVANTGHFGWGFRLLDAALYFAALVPIVLLIETVCIVVKIVRVVRAKEALAVVQTLAMYIVSAWLLWILFLLMLIN